MSKEPLSNRGRSEGGASKRRAWQLSSIPKQERDGRVQERLALADNSREVNIVHFT